MPLICPCCGTKIEKYAAYVYTVDYLESYLEDYFKKDISILRSRYITKQDDQHFRRICFYIIMKYAKINLASLGRRYGINGAVIKGTQYFMEMNHHDLKFIEKDLSDDLPEVIK